MCNESHDFLPEMGDQEGPQPGPSWGNPKWLAEVVDSAGGYPRPPCTLYA